LFEIRVFIDFTLLLAITLVIKVTGGNSANQPKILQNL